MTQAMNLANFSNSVDASGQIAPTVLNAAVPVSKGGTGATTAASARTNLDVAQAVYAVPSGGIIMWSGSIATIPTGWLLCNGSSGTPDLRNRFVIGAYADSSGIANTTITGANTQTGGSKDAIIVSHNHTVGGVTVSTTTALTGAITGISETFANGGGSCSGVFTKQNGFPKDKTPQTTDVTDAGQASIDVNHTHSLSGSTDTTGSSGTNANLVPYYALAFIMKS
jgi:hypothetical protein